MPSEPSRAGAVGGEGGAVDVSGSAAAVAGIVGRDILQERRRGHEEQIAGHGAAEIQQPIVIAGRPADEHIFQHLLDRSRRTRVADEIGAEFALPGAAEGHVVAEDLHLFAVLDDRGQRVMRGGRLDRVVELDVGKLGAADDAFLGFGRTARSSRP